MSRWVTVFTLFVAHSDAVQDELMGILSSFSAKIPTPILVCFVHADVHKELDNSLQEL